MDWQRAIIRNREALLAVVSALMVSLGLSAGGTLTTLPYFLYRKALRLLRQAESALRRLIVIAAYELSLRGIKLRKPRVTQTDFVAFKVHLKSGVPTFNLIDPLKIFGQDAPDFAGIYAEHCGVANHERICAASLGRRILALKHALETIPHQAKRLARWHDARDLARRQNQPHRQSPMRPGPPPASGRVKRTVMDALLSECHCLAIYARERRDSS